MNLYAMQAIYNFEMARFKRTFWQSLVTPVLTTSLYFIVFGAAIGSRMNSVDGVTYGAFIVPGLIMLSVFTESLNNASFGIYLPRFTGTIYEVLSAPVSAFEIVLAYVGAATPKSILLGFFFFVFVFLFLLFFFLFFVWSASYLASGRRVSSSSASSRCWSSRRSPSSAGRSTLSPCCPSSGAPSVCSTRSFISSTDFAGPSTARRM